MIVDERGPFLPDPSWPMGPLVDGAWAGRAAIVIGGGSSLGDTSWQAWEQRLAPLLEVPHQPYRVIAVNRAYQAGLIPDVVYSMDYSFWKWAAQDPRLQELDADGAAQVHLDLGGHGLPPGATHLARCTGSDHRAAEWGTSLATGLGAGWHSGFGAVNLADVLGADPIYLLGFDYQGDWWHGHEDGPWSEHGPREDVVQARYVAAFETVRAQVRARVVNCNPRSRLRCFEFGEVGS